VTTGHVYHVICHVMALETVKMDLTRNQKIVVSGEYRKQICPRKWRRLIILHRPSGSVFLLFVFCKLKTFFVSKLRRIVCRKTCEIQVILYSSSFIL